MTAKTTEQMLLDIFKDLQQRPDFPVADITKRVALVSTPRCGSTMFCDALYNSGLIGQPMEWLNRRYIQAYAELMGISNVNFPEYLDFIFRKTTVNGIFAVNFHVEQFRDMKGLGFDVWSLQFDHVYYLCRQQKIDQAWSLAKATVTDQWSADTVQKKEANIGAEHLFKMLMYLYQEEKYYQQHIEDKVQQTFFYEDFGIEKKNDAYTRIFQDLDLPVDAVEQFTTSMKKQSSTDPQLQSLKKWMGIE